LNVTSLANDELPAVIKEDVEDYLENHPRSPAARLRPRMGMVGDVWLAFIDPELQRGASRLGETPFGRAGGFQSAFDGATHFSKRFRTRLGPV